MNYPTEAQLAKMRELWDNQEIAECVETYWEERFETEFYRVRDESLTTGGDGDVTIDEHPCLLKMHDNHNKAIGFKQLTTELMMSFVNNLLEMEE